jgi:hypothetical protein
MDDSFPGLQEDLEIVHKAKKRGSDPGVKIGLRCLHDASPG